MKNNIIPIVYYRTNFMNTYFLLTLIPQHFDLTLFISA